MADRTINLGYDEYIDIVLPDGQKISLGLSYLEPGEQLPELDIMFPRTMAVNTYGPGLTASKPHGDDPGVRLAKQIIVPIESKRKRKDGE